MTPLMKFIFSFRIVWLLYCIFTIIHVFANYRAVRAVNMATLNQPRYHYVVQKYLLSDTTTTMDIKQANRREPVVLRKFWRPHLFFRF